MPKYRLVSEDEQQRVPAGRLRMIEQGPPPMSYAERPLRRMDILPPAQNEVPQWARGLPKFSQSWFEEGEQRALDEWREKVAWESQPGRGNIGLTFTPSPELLERIAVDSWERAGRKPPEKTVSRKLAAASGFADVATFTLSDELGGAMKAAETLATTGDIGKAKRTYKDVRDGMNNLKDVAIFERPLSTRVGQTGALLVPTGAIYTAAPRVGSAAVRAVLPRVANAAQGTSAGARGLRYAGRMAALGGAGAADYYLYNLAAEADNQARLAGRASPGLVERVQYATDQIPTTGGLVAAAAGPLSSFVYRPTRYAVTSAINTGKATVAANLAMPASVRAQGFPRFEWKGGSFTPKDVQARVGVGGMQWNESLRQRVIDRILDEGFDPDTAERMVRMLSYDNYSSVNEMLFELDSTLKSLATAVGRSRSTGEDVMREAFAARREAMPEDLRDALRRAVGASGDDLETFAARMEKAATEASAEGYAKAHARQVSDGTWQSISALLSDVGEEGVQAARSGARLARNAARRRPEYVAAAQELEDIAAALKGGQPLSRKPSTLALDYLDRAIGGRIGEVSRVGNAPYAATLLDFRNALRSSGLDADTGLNVPRTIYAQYKLAQEALEFGEKSFGKGRSLRDMKRQFVADKMRADAAAEAGIGEGSGVIDQALMMGWVRGAENAIDMADNPGAMIRQLYGSQRQREKLLSMLMELPDEAPAGFKSDVTKRKKALVGSRGVHGQDYTFDFAMSTGERARGKTQMRSLFDRQRDMLESERIVVGGSPTAGAAEALAEHGGRERAVKWLTALTDLARDPAGSVARAVARTIDRINEPMIFHREASRELASILSVRGREQLLEVIDEIRQRKLARSGGGGVAMTPPGSQSAGNGLTNGPGGGSRPSGIAADIRNAIGGAWAGGVLPIPSTGDLETDLENRLNYILIGAGAGAVSRPLLRLMNKGRDVAGGDGQDQSLGFLPTRSSRPAPKPSQLPRRDGFDWRRGLTDTAITTAALGLAFAPPARADTGQEQRQKIQQRIDELLTREKAVVDAIAQYEEELARYNALELFEKQKFLNDKGYAGENGKPLALDGDTGKNTKFAGDAYKGDMRVQIGDKKAELQAIQNEINQLRVQLAEQQEENPSNPWVDKGLEVGTYIAGLLAAYKFRNAALRESEILAKQVADDANSLLTRLPVPPKEPPRTVLSRIPVVGRRERERIEKARQAARNAAKKVEDRLSGKKIPPISPDPTSVDGLQTRAANVEEFYRRAADGVYGPVSRMGRLLEPVTSRVRGNDLKVTAAGAVDAYYVGQILEKTRADIAAEEKRLEAARNANDFVRIEQSRKRLAQLREVENMLAIAQRIGIGLAAGGMLATWKGKYAKPEPRFEAAARERELVELARASPEPPLVMEPPKKRRSSTDPEKATKGSTSRRRKKSDG